MAELGIMPWPREKFLGFWKTPSGLLPGLGQGGPWGDGIMRLSPGGKGRQGGRERESMCTRQ